MAMLTHEHVDTRPERSGAPAAPRRFRWRLALAGIALALFFFWLGARLGPLTVFGSAGGLSQGTWLPTPVPAEAYIGGAVTHPGLYLVGPTTRLADLLRKAGGPARHADLTHVNLAARVHDGETFAVPDRHGKGCPGT
jgi:competence protein ComEA